MKYVSEEDIRKELSNVEVENVFTEGYSTALENLLSDNLQDLPEKCEHEWEAGLHFPKCKKCGEKLDGLFNWSCPSEKCPPHLYKTYYVGKDNRCVKCGKYESELKEKDEYEGVDENPRKEETDLHRPQVPNKVDVLFYGNCELHNSTINALIDCVEYLMRRVEG